MTKALTLLIFLLCIFYARSQQYIGIKATGGASKFALKTSTGFQLGSTTTFFGPSAQAGIFYQHHNGSRSCFGGELLYTYLDGKIENKFGGYSSSSFTVFPSVAYAHLQVQGFSFPIYYGLKFKRLIVHLGLQTSVTVATRYRVRMESYENNSTRVIYEDDSRLSVSTVDLGPKGGVMYNVTRRFGLEASYYFGYFPGMLLRVHQISAGLRWSIIGLRRHDENGKAKADSDQR